MKSPVLIKLLQFTVILFKIRSLLKSIHSFQLTVYQLPWYSLQLKLRTTRSAQQQNCVLHFDEIFGI